MRCHQQDLVCVWRVGEGEEEEENERDMEGKRRKEGHDCYHSRVYRVGEGEEEEENGRRGGGEERRGGGGGRRGTLPHTCPGTQGDLPITNASTICP